MEGSETVRVPPSRVTDRALALATSHVVNVFGPEWVVRWLDSHAPPDLVPRVAGRHQSKCLMASKPRLACAHCRKRLARQSRSSAQSIASSFWRATAERRQVGTRGAVERHRPP